MSRPIPRGTYRRSCRTCGWTGTYDTAARGDYAKRKHSCEKKQRVDATRARGDSIRIRNANLDRTPRPCHHKQTTHEHGTHACYALDTCRCLPCAEAHSLYEQQRVRNNAYGRSNYVDADPARQHIRALMDRGMGLKRIVAVSDVSQGALWKLIYGKRRPDGTQQPSKRVTRDLERRILAIEFDLADGAKVDGQQTARRLQALVANGWSGSKLADRLGMLRTNFTPLLHGRRGVLVSTVKAVHALYAELVDVDPPEATHRDKISVSRARRYAQQNGWAKPLRINGRAWIGKALDLPDDTTVDLEDDVVDESAVLRRLDGDRSVRLNPDERDEVVRRWQASGRPLNEMERITGINSHRYLSDQKQAS